MTSPVFAGASRDCSSAGKRPADWDSREDLQQALSRASGGVLFTTIQKFAPEKGAAYPPDLEDAAVRGVLAQAEAMLAEISV